MDNRLILKIEDDIPRKNYKGLGYELFHNMKKFKNNTALISTENGTKQTYGTILQKSIRTALSLKAKNSGEEPIIGVCARSHSNSFIPLYSSLFLGYKVVPFDGSLSVNDTSYLLKEVITPTIMFIDDVFVSLMEEAMEKSGRTFELIVFGENHNYQNFERDYLKEQKEEEINFEPIRLKSNKETAVILFSSGSTGFPKGICLSHLGLLIQTENLIYLQNLSSNSVINNVISLVWLTSLLWSFAFVFTGATNVSAPITELWKAINDFKITHIFMSPYFVSLLIKEGKPKNCNVDSVISFSTSGAKFNSYLKNQLRNLLPKTMIIDTYGQTETTGWLAMFRVGNKKDEQLARSKDESVGRPTPGILFKVVDIETRQLLGPNKTGELCLKNDSIIMNGYYKKDSSNEFDSDGWLKTGDLAYYDEEKCIFIVGRCKELLKYRNFHIQPQMLEQILNAHPAVDKSVVIGIKHEIDGDLPLGLVVLHDGQNISAEEIEKYVEEKVDERQKLRGGVKIIKDIPFTATGKPKRAEIKRMVEEGLI